MEKSKEYILEILNLISKYGRGYIVGGYIRDIFLGIEPKDCDFSTSLSLKKIIEIFSEIPNYDIKIISEKLNIVKIKRENFSFEIARMREDLKYYSSRKNLDFIFTEDIKKDLLRRDFTVNSFAFDGKTLFYLNKKSILDLKSKNLSFIGDCEIKIKEDPFRILRIFRFLSEKSFKSIDEKNLKIIKKNKNLIWNLPKEMIKFEFIKIIKGKNYLNTFKLINLVELFDEIFLIEDYEEDYQERLKSLLKDSDLSLLEKLNFSKKIIRKINM